MPRTILPDCGMAGRIAHGFIDSKLTPLVIVGGIASRCFQHS